MTRVFLFRSNASSSKRSSLDMAPEAAEVRKLDDRRKKLMEQKLGGGESQNTEKQTACTLLLHPFPLPYTGKLKKWNTVDEVHRTVDIPEAPHRQSGLTRAPLPPPPPPPPLQGAMRPHGAAADENGEPPSPTGSSFYSPGKESCCTAPVLPQTQSPTG